MIYLLAAVLCSLGIGMIFKYTAQQGMDRIALLTVNYFVALVVSWVQLPPGVHLNALDASQTGLWVLGTVTGTLFILGFFLFALATHWVGMALSIGVMRLSVLIPVLASWFIWGEVPTFWQGVGIVVASFAFFFIARPASPSQLMSTHSISGARSFAILAALFLTGGTVDLTLKVFDEQLAATYPLPAFLLIVFAVAFLIGFVIVGYQVYQDKRYQRAVWWWGIGLGVINYGAAFFLLRAVELLPGPLVFPANSIAIVFGGAILGWAVWREHISVINAVGLVMAGAALAMISLG